MQKSVLTMLAAASLALLGGCATQGESRRMQASEQVAPARMAAVRAAAGPAVSSLTLGTGPTARIYSWEALSNRELLLYTRPDKAWLLGLGPCPYLFQSPFVAVSSRMGQIDHFSQVYAFRGVAPCRIKTIQPVDVGQLKIKPGYRMGATTVSHDGWHDASRR
ncbi:MAG TPA: DUF6491 family protein [Rhodanobacteraceae bacterium]